MVWKVGPLTEPEADALNRLEERVTRLERPNVCPPLYSQRGPAGIAIGLDVGALPQPDSPLDGSGILVDVVHVVGVTFVGPDDANRRYTCVRVDRNEFGHLQETTLRKVYTGVFEAQNRDAVIDPTPTGSIQTQPTHELPLFLDDLGRYFFQIDQYTTGYDGPFVDPGYATTTPLAGHVSTGRQVIPGPKTFADEMRVNRSRAGGAFDDGFGNSHTFTVYSNLYDDTTVEQGPYSFRLQQFAGLPFTYASVGNDPAYANSPVDASLFVNGQVQLRQGLSIFTTFRYDPGSWQMSLFAAVDDPGRDGVGYTYWDTFTPGNDFAIYQGSDNPLFPPFSLSLFHDGPVGGFGGKGEAFGVAGYYGGWAFPVVARPGGGSMTLWFMGGLFIQAVLDDGSIIGQPAPGPGRIDPVRGGPGILSPVAPGIGGVGAGSLLGQFGPVVGPPV